MKRIGGFRIISGNCWVVLKAFVISAQDAFIKVGKLLQKRRKTDLYETVSYFVGTEKDPADEDVELQEKLTHNKRFHTKISDLIDK